MAQTSGRMAEGRAWFAGIAVPDIRLFLAHVNGSAASGQTLTGRLPRQAVALRQGPVLAEKIARDPVPSAVATWAVGSSAITAAKRRTPGRLPPELHRRSIGRCRSPPQRLYFLLFVNSIKERCRIAYGRTPLLASVATHRYGAPRSHRAHADAGNSQHACPWGDQPFVDDPCCAACCRLPDASAGHRNRRRPKSPEASAQPGGHTHTAAPATLHRRCHDCHTDGAVACRPRHPPVRRHPVDQGRGQPANRGRHHPLLSAGPARRPVRPGPHRSQPEDPVRHRPVPGCAARPRRRHAGGARGRKPDRQPRRFEGNHKLTDDQLRPELQLRPRAVFTAGAGRGRPPAHPRSVCQARLLRRDGRAEDHPPGPEPRRRRLPDQRRLRHADQQDRDQRQQGVQRGPAVGGDQQPRIALVALPVHLRPVRSGAAGLRQGTAAPVLPEERLCRHPDHRCQRRTVARPQGLLPVVHGQRRRPLQGRQGHHQRRSFAT